MRPPEKLLLRFNSLPGPCGIPGLDSNPGLGIFKKKIPGFFGIRYGTQIDVFKDLFWFSDNLRVFWGLPEPFKVLQMFTLQYGGFLPISVKSFYAACRIVQLYENITGFISLLSCLPLMNQHLKGSLSAHKRWERLLRIFSHKYYQNSESNLNSLTKLLKTDKSVAYVLIYTLLTFKSTIY